MDDYKNFKEDFFSLLQTSTIESTLDKLSTLYTIRKISQTNSQFKILNNFLMAKRIEEKSEATLSLYRIILTKFFSLVSCSFDEITANDIRQFLFTYKQQNDVTNSTLETCRRVLNSFYEWCLSEELILKNPMKNIAPIKCEVKPRRTLKLIELEYIRQSCITLREKALIDFLFSTGCRISEASNAKIEDIDWDKRTILIHNGKGNKTRETYLNAECEVSLRAYLESRNNPSPYIFIAERKTNKPNLTPKSLQNIIQKICSRTTISTKVTPHTFRHTAATIALRNGMPIEQVQRFLGHRNINTTMIYAEVDQEDVRRSHNKYLS